MLRGPGEPAEPQLAVESCASRSRTTCAAELLTLAPVAPLQVTARTGGPDASAAANGGEIRRVVNPRFRAREG
jgi:hypothetical protein